MKNGFVKVAAASPSIRVADCDYNVNECIGIAKEAAGAGVKVLVFPELCISSYSCADLFLTKTLTDASLLALEKFIGETKSLDILCITGLPIIYRDKLYNCAAVTKGGKLLGLVPKTNIPNYSEFYEMRHFNKAPEENGVFDFLGNKVPFGNKLIFEAAGYSALRIGVEICEDVWVSAPPSNELASAGALIIANLSASNETVGKDAYRLQLVKSQSAKTVSAYIFADAGEGESTTDLVFAGHCIIAENGTLLTEKKPFDFNRKYITTDIDLERLTQDRKKTNTVESKEPERYEKIEFETKIVETKLERAIDPLPFIPSDRSEMSRRAEEILNIQSYGLKTRLERSYSKKCVIGISGGLDSTLALLVAARANDLLGRLRKDIIGVTMPCFGTTKRTKSNAEKLCEELGVDFRCIVITDAVKVHFKDIGHDIDDHNVVFENAQARERTQVIMDIANAEGGLVIGTGDLSELALGWATYNGDHMSMYGVNSSVPKTLIRHIVAYCADTEAAKGNKALSLVLRDVLDTPVSPELLPANDKGEIDQKTEDIVGPYELHDFYLFNMIRYGFTPDKLLRLAENAFAGKYDRKTLLHWLEIFTRRFFAQQFKRSCLPDGPKVGTVALSPRGDLRMPSDASSAGWLKIIEQLKNQ